jgi:hypothetical protein
MHRALIATTLLFVGLQSISASAADGFVVWMEADTPDEKARKKVYNLSGAEVHVAHVDLAFPPQPATDEDAARIEGLRETVASGKSRWDDFDVELTIARELEASLVTIDLIRDKRDLQDIVDGRLFQGAAVLKAFDPEVFATAEDAQPFRTDMPGFTGNAPWLSALAIDPEREFTRADVADGSAYPKLQALLPTYQELVSGQLDLSKLPSGATLIVDGREIAVNDEGLAKLRPGRHYSHVLRNGKVSGRQFIQVASGEKLQLPLIVDQTELEQARAQVLLGLTTGLPEDVKASIETLGKHNTGPIFIAALDGKGHVKILPYARGAQLNKAKPVTFLVTAEFGGGLIISSLFNDADGKNVTAPAVMGNLGFELGVYNFAFLGGMDIALTPSNTVQRGSEGDDVVTSILPRPWGGAGVYVLRPSGTTPTMIIAGTYGWNYPAHLAVGGRIAFGVPIDQQGTWFRILLGGDASPRSMWPGELADISMYSMYLRFGLSARL